MMVSKKTTSVSMLEKITAVLALLLSTGSIIPILRQGGRLNTENTADPLMQILWSIVYGMMAVLVAMHWTSVRELLRVNWIMVPLMALPLISAAWSVDPVLTFQRSIALLGTTLLAVFLSARFSPTQILGVLSWALGIAMFASILFVVFLPEYALDTSSRGVAWNGAFTTKGQLGRMMVIASILWVWQLVHDGRLKLNILVVLTLSVTCVVMSESKTALVALALIIPVSIVFSLFKRRASIGFGLLFLWAVIAAITVPYYSRIVDDSLGFLGRDADLTGRTELWSITWEAIQEKFWLGYGYSGFWMGKDGPSVVVWRELFWEPPHAHNGYLEVWINLGLVGLVIVVALIVQGLYHAIKLCRIEGSLFNIFSASLLLFIAITNITEISLMTQNSFYWVLTLVCVFASAKQASTIERSVYSSEPRRDYQGALLLRDIGSS
jgi:exopolysaccharide production protein ExoQ